MPAFLAAAAVLALLAMAAVLLGPRLQRRERAVVSQPQASAVVLREQLREIEADRERRVLDDAQFDRVREDLQRRMLAEAAGRDAVPDPVRNPRRVLLLVGAALPVAAALLYLQFGHPQMLLGAPVQPPSTPAEHGAGDMLAQLEAHLAVVPGDARAWVMLARARMGRDRFDEAAAAYRRALDASPGVARDPLIWCEYADAVGMAQGGRLAGRPRELIDRALALDPAHPRALEMAGSAAYEAGDFRGAARYWQQLLARLPAASPEHAQLAAAVARAEQRARFVLPAS